MTSFISRYPVGFQSSDSIIQLSYSRSMVRCELRAGGALDFDVQVVPVEQQHTHERSAARSVGLDMSRLAVPVNRNVVNVESYFSHCR